MATKLLRGVSAPWKQSLQAAGLVCRFEFTDLPLVSDGADLLSGRKTSIAVGGCSFVKGLTSAAFGLLPEPCPISILPLGNPAGPKKGSSA